MKRAKTRLLLVSVVSLAIWTTALAQETQWEKLNNAGMQAYERGDYAKTEKLLLAALKEAEKFGGDDPSLASALNNLAGAKEGIAL
jgi:hypothetical protein